MEHLQTIKEEITEHGGVVFYSISDADIRLELEQICQKSKVPYLSILDPAVRTLSKVLGKPSTARIGAQHRMDEAYFNRMEAWNSLFIMMMVRQCHRSITPIYYW